VRDRRQLDEETILRPNPGGRVLIALTTAAAAAVAAAGGLSASSLPTNGALLRRVESPGSVSSNWAGYVVTANATPENASSLPGSTTPNGFTSVTGTWTQPKVTCTAGNATYSAAWVGLGGIAESTQGLEQTGTDADCSATGKPRYFAWYELIPAPAVPVNLKILPGDTITASVNANAAGILVQIKNRTRHTSFTKQLSIAAPDLTSAEWIVEAPSACSQGGRCQVLPLANFGTVSFTRIATIGNGQPGTLSSPAWMASPIQLQPEQGSTSGFASAGSLPGATPAGLSADGRAFNVSWQANAAAGRVG
jgi:hypothetical protein